jgi:hypothetical protein
MKAGNLAPLWNEGEASLGMHPIAMPEHVRGVSDGIPDGAVKPCKACDGAPALGYQRALSNVWIACSECGAMGPWIAVGLRPTEAELKAVGAAAVAAWNGPPA